MIRLKTILKKREVILLASLFLCIKFSFAQLYNFKKISVEEGLSAHGVYSICEGPKGKLWIGLEGEGVNVYDGWEIKHYSKHHLGANIRVIYKDSRNRMWFGSSNQGISILDGDSLSRITTQEGLFVNHIRGIVEDENGVIWVASFGGGISVIDEGRVIRNYGRDSGLPSLNCRTILVRKNGEIWVGTDKGIAVIKSGEVETVFSDTEVLQSRKILALDEDDSGMLWVGTTKGLSIVKGERVLNIKNNNKLRSSRIKSIHGIDGEVGWFGTRSGLGKVEINDFENGVYSVNWYDDQNGLSNNRVRCIYEDESKAIWVGTYFGGVSRLFNESFSIIDKSNGLHDNVITALSWNKNDSSLWMGSHDYGLSVWRENGVVNVDESNGLSNNQITSIAHFSSNSSILGTIEGVNLISDNEFQRVWDSYDGLFKSNRIKDVVSNGTTVLGLTSSSELFVLQDTGRVYLDTLRTEIMNQMFTSYVNSISEIDGSFWISEDTVLRKLKISPEGIRNLNSYPLGKVGEVVGSNKDFIGYTLDNSVFRVVNSEIVWELPLGQSEEIKFLLKEKHNTYWLGLKTKIMSLQFDDGLGVDIKDFSLNEGFMGGSANKSAITKDEKGEVYIGMIRGLLKIKPNSYKGVKRDLKVFFEKILDENNKEIDLQKYCDSIVDGVPYGLNLPHRMKHLTFLYKSYHLKSPNEVKYKLSISGDVEFSFETNKTEEEFVELRPGDYELRIESKTQWGDWSKSPLIIKFEITPPFWMTKSFQIAFIIMIVGIVVAAFKLRTRKLEKEKKKLEKVVAERTKDLNAEKQKSENLLLNILPVGIASELKQHGFAKTRRYEKASVLFTDFKGFTAMSTQMKPEILVKKLDEIFVAFDEVIERNSLEKIKTIGDAYMCASGIPDENPNQVKNIVLAGLQLVEVMDKFNERQKETSEPEWNVRVGVHTGELIAGVVGKKKFAYDVWGDTVNIASRMESNSEPGRVNVSVETMEEVQEYFEFESRGKIEAKNRGELDMYFVNGLSKQYLKGNSQFSPNNDFYS